MTTDAGAAPGSFQRFVARSSAEGHLVVQARMGFSDVHQMRRGLVAVREARATTVGTVTLDSYTRVGDHPAAQRALAAGQPLNGYPLVALSGETNAALLKGVHDCDFPVQARHGSALPLSIVREVVASGMAATEGGPVSYCLPYSRVPLQRAVDEWARCADLAAESAGAGRTMHLETFGGCMLGQLCPPSLLVALSLLEAVFFHQHGVRSLSLSYAQQTHVAQDTAAVLALRRLAGEYLVDTHWHVVLYTFMGVFPHTPLGAYRLLEDSVRIAVTAGAERLVVKTPAEASRIPTIEENVSALEFAAALAATITPADLLSDDHEVVYAEAKAIIDATLELGTSVGVALVTAFARGVLDVPFCLHSDNANRSRAAVDGRGRLGWVAAGGLPVRVRSTTQQSVRAVELLRMLEYNRSRFDREALTGVRTPVLS